MGTINGFRCSDCGYEFTTTADFDSGMLGIVVAPVVCPEHGIQSADTGAKALDRRDMEKARSRSAFPCPTCGRESPRWDRGSCPKCDGKIDRNQIDRLILWD